MPNPNRCYGINRRVLDSAIPDPGETQHRSIEVWLVNAHHVKNVPGRKTDVADCQWIQHLHSVGLLRASFRPDDEICAIRSLWRHRDNLIQLATLHLQHMQKALDQMNLQIHHVISDLAGTTGLATRINWHKCGTRAFGLARRRS
jgi:hypothetical protein